MSYKEIGPSVNNFCFGVKLSKSLKLLESYASILAKFM
jgi:hypothetical protein